MKYLSSNTPVYDWANNKGYGSKKHRAAIVEHGVTEYHRMSFLGNILPKNTNNLF
jgi:ribonuclease HII